MSSEVGTVRDECVRRRRVCVCVGMGFDVCDSGLVVLLCMQACRVLRVRVC